VSSQALTADQKEVTKLQELAYELKVGQAMTTDVTVVSLETTMAEFREVLRSNRISGTPVVNNGDLVGIISIEDLINALAAGELKATVAEKMTPDPETLYGDEPLIHAVSKFGSLGYGRFPVINRQGDLVGVLVEGDIVRALLRRLEVEYHAEELHRYRASHIFEDVIADRITLVSQYEVPGGDFVRAGEASGKLKTTLARLGIDPRVVRRLAIATYEAEMNLVIYAGGGEIIAEVTPERIRVAVIDSGPGIPDVDQAMEPGYSTAPDWVRELGFGAGMGLPNIQNCSDEMKLESTVGVGTQLEFVIYL
jgi:CBS domain-containing protein/anti-sigma regulatory factor (Ser/Thr protein kinase)